MKYFVKWLKGLGIAVLVLPIALPALFLGYEIFGMCANRVATARQTRALRQTLEREIPDLAVLSTDSRTGNTTGTGNHVECQSVVTFATGMGQPELEACLTDYYRFDGGSCELSETPDGNYTICVTTSAPFADNLEGH